MPKKAKMMLETRNPVVGEFMRAFLPVACRFVTKNTIFGDTLRPRFGCDPCKSAGDYASQEWLPRLASRLCHGFCAEMRLARGCQQPPGQQTRLSILMSAAGARPESRFELSARR